MSNSEPSRLDRLEALAETILAGLQETRAIASSNAKSIQSLSEEWRQERKEWQQDRRRVFEWMARLAAAQADFYEAQADYLHHIERIDDRITELLERLIPKNEQQSG